MLAGIHSHGIKILSSEEIAFLLGYQDTNSYFRVFSLWTGKTITEYTEGGK